MNSTKTILTAALLMLIVAATAVAADYPEPQRGSFTQEDVERARLMARADASGELPNWEDMDTGVAFDASIHAPTVKVPGVEDNDTGHYARGSTLIIHVFINHTGGTWDATERSGAAAKAQVAKDYFADNAPPEANMRFDNAFWQYTGTLGYFIPDSGTNGAVIEDALADIGFADSDGDGTRVDDMTFFLQNWNGGYDNVIAVFQADQTGRAWASYGTATTVLYTDSNANVWAHEWGHTYGACDEYVEGGQCNGGIDCGLCQSWYLDYDQDNDNCQLVSCPDDVNCLMIFNSFANICDATLHHWAWWDGNADGQLDIVHRHLSGVWPGWTFTNIWEIWHNGWFYWSATVDQGMALHQKWNSWMVCGLRSPAGDPGDYDLRLYTDNNHLNQVASSGYVGSDEIDFVVGDYNHNRLGNEHIAIVNFGATGNYNLTFESGTGVLYPDGISRPVNWQDYNTVRAYDVPLMAGETLTFWSWNVSAGLDVGMALYRSNGDTYFGGRSSNVAQSNSGGNGATESFTYTVPEDDVYGLVVWGNNAVDGSFEIQIGPTPATLAEESPFISGLDLRLYNYDPNAIYWSVVGSRSPAGTLVDLFLFTDENYQDLEEVSANYSDVEFIAVDYLHAPLNRDYPRLRRVSGTDNHNTEWEHDPEVIAGVVSGSWSSDHVVKVWDFRGTAGQNYFFRQYQGAVDLNGALYFMSSDDGDNYKRRSAYLAFSNFHPAVDGGEWFNVTVPATDWYGFVLTDIEGTSGSYSIWGGPDIFMSDDVKDTRGDEVVFASNSVVAGYWTVFGARPAPSDQVSVWLYGDDAYTIDTLAVSDQNGAGVSFVVGDYNHNSTGTTYPRFYRRVGGSNVDLEWEGGFDTISSAPGTQVNLTWPTGDVAKAWDMLLTTGQSITVRVEDLSGQLDLGVAMFSSNGTTYYAFDTQAAVYMDANGLGGNEEFSFTAPDTDWYGLIVFNQNDNGGNYRIRVLDPAVPVEDEVFTFGLRAMTANPFTGSVGLQYSVTRSGPVQVDIYDVRGRRVRTLMNESREPGAGLLVWDGKSEAGENVPGGVYLARMTAGNQDIVTKLVRVE